MFRNSIIQSSNIDYISGWYLIEKSIYNYLKPKSFGNRFHKLSRINLMNSILVCPIFIVQKSIWQYVNAADFNERRKLTTGVYWCFYSVSTSLGNTAKQQREKTEKINIKPSYNFCYIVVLTSYSIHLNTQKHRNLLDNTIKSLHIFRRRGYV